MLRSIIAVPAFVFLLPCLTFGYEMILDDYSSNQNFVDGKYTFVQAFNSPLNNPNVSGGTLNPNFAPNTFAT